MSVPSSTAGPRLRDAFDATYRAHPALELVLFDRLPPDDRRALADLARDPELYGVLRARDESRSLRAVCRETALLFLTLREPGRIPAYLRGDDDDQLIVELTRMVLDGILEVHRPDERFVSGPDTAPMLADDARDEAAPSHPLARLSLDALRYGHRLGLRDAAALSQRLYRYHQLPATPAWRRRLASADDVARFLRLSEPGTRRALRAEWREAASDDPAEGWRHWSRRGVSAPSRWKMYVSIRPECLPDGFVPVVHALSESAATAFKVGRDLGGILRPDKLVAYFEESNALHAATAGMGAAVKTLAAHGVPFTAPLDEHGALSWGLDPAPDPSRPPWLGPSWRRCITDRLALALIDGADDAEPWRHACRRLRLDGIDPDSWQPVSPGAAEATP